MSAVICHSEETANHFYVAEKSVSEVQSVRQALEAVLGLCKTPKSQAEAPTLQGKHIAQRCVMSLSSVSEYEVGQC